MVNLKHMSGNFNAWEEMKTGSPDGQYWNPPKSPQQRSFIGGEAAWLLSPARCLFQSLLWIGCLGNQSSSQALALQEEKPLSPQMVCAVMPACKQGTYKYSTYNYSRALYHLGLCKYTMNFTQRRNHLKSPNNDLSEAPPSLSGAGL